MFTSYNLVNQSTGKVASQTWAPITSAKAGFVVVETSHESKYRLGVWDVETMSYVTPPAHKRYTRTLFLELFTDQELSGILAASKVDPNVELFLMKLKLAEVVDLDYQPAIDAINGMAAGGLITQEKAAVILA